MDDCLEDMMACDSQELSIPTYSKPKAPIGNQFEQLINLQSSDGYWSKDPYFPSINSIKSMLNSVSETVIYTLLALHWLETIYNDKENEWEMISKKAKKWIRKQNVKDSDIEMIKS